MIPVWGVWVDDDYYHGGPETRRGRSYPEHGPYEVEAVAMVTLAEIAQHPQRLTKTIVTAQDEALVFRPLTATDAGQLARFLNDLSPETRRLSTFDSYDLNTAQEMCDAIARYDKLRFVLETKTARIVGLLEFSFAILESDTSRYESYDIALDPETDCRFGPTLADDYQSKGIGSLVMPLMGDVARRFGCRRIILWGGVLAANAQAIRFYQKNGFQTAGKFTNQDGIECLDMLLLL